MQTLTIKPSISRTTMLFAIPSLLGIMFFMMPVMTESGMTFPLALMAKTAKGLLGNHIFALATGVMCISAIFSLLTTLFRPAWITGSSLLSTLFQTTPEWLMVRIAGVGFAVMAQYKLGSEMVWSSNTGGLVFFDLLPSLLVTFFLAGLLLPLLLDFGLLELLGTLMSKVMRPVFRLPGRAAIDCISSWLGDGTVGIMLTSSQYENKKYTAREAAVVATMFSIVGISFSLVVLTQVGLQDHFLPFYFAICLSGVIAAILLQRIPPLSNKKDLFIDGSAREHDDELIPEGRSALSYGYELALERASKVDSLKSVAAQGVKSGLGMVFGVLPVVMAIGTAGLIVAEYTSLFSLLGAPFVPLLKLLQLPEAKAASEAVLVGFTDMFVPSILAASINSEITRFVIAALSVTQLIFMSETGAVILGSKIPLNLLELLAIFLLRTLVTLPIIVLVGHMVF
ncbi:YjiH family protein [Endozoicomonadaceae bacterium StTr2]